MSIIEGVGQEGKVVSGRYVTPKARYSPPPPSSGGAPPPPSSGGAPPPSAMQAGVLEVDSARFATYPNEIAVMYLSTPMEIANNTVTPVVFNLTTGRTAFADGLQRDLTNLDRIYITGTPSKCIYIAFGFVEWEPHATGLRHVHILSGDGLLNDAVATDHGNNASELIQNFYIALERQETDTYLQLTVEQTSATALDVQRAQFGIMRVK